VPQLTDRLLRDAWAAYRRNALRALGLAALLQSAMFSLQFLPSALQPAGMGLLVPVSVALELALIVLLAQGDPASSDPEKPIWRTVREGLWPGIRALFISGFIVLPGWLILALIVGDRSISPELQALGGIPLMAFFGAFTVVIYQPIALRGSRSALGAALTSIRVARRFFPVAFLITLVPEAAVTLSGITAMGGRRPDLAFSLAGAITAALLLPFFYAAENALFFLVTRHVSQEPQAAPAE